MWRMSSLELTTSRGYDMEEIINSSAPVSQNDEPITAIDEISEPDTEVEGAHDVQDNITLDTPLASDALSVTEPPQNNTEPPHNSPNPSGELEALRAELEKERSLRVRGEVKLACISLLEEHSLPLSLCDILTCDSVEETQARVEEVSKIVREAVFEQVCARLATIPTPSEGGHAMTVAEFKSLSLADMQRLYKTDKELYNELSRKI